MGGLRVVQLWQQVARALRVVIVHHGKAAYVVAIGVVIEVEVIGVLMLR